MTSRTHHDSSIASKVVNGLTHGQTPRQIADHLNLPLDFIDLIISQERNAGRLDVYDLRSCNSSSGQGCNPDPESLVCSGCPILPMAIRRRQSVMARMKSKFRK
jgi:hypothetical protein